MKALKLSVILACLMAGASIVGVAARPSKKVDASAPRFVLESIVPAQFGEWRKLPNAAANVVNPQTEELLNKLYSQILTRTYANGAGYRIMLSLAYGDDQRATLQAHKPEVCYPAQGFTLHSSEEARIATPYGDIATRQLRTSLGPRKEPVTYWFTVGDSAVRNKLEQRLIEVRFGLTGQVPDGLLFRVSSIDADPERAFALHQTFVNDLLSAMPTQDRARLSGLTTVTAQ